MKTQKLFVIVVSICLMAFFNVLSFAQTTPEKSYYLQPDDVQPDLAGSMAETLANTLEKQGYDVNRFGSSVQFITSQGKVVELNFERNGATVSVDGMVVNQDDSEDPNTNLLLALQKLQSCLAAADLLYDVASLACEFSVFEVSELLCETEAILKRISNTAQCIAQFEYLSGEVVANAGADQAVDTGTQVTLDGSGSTPPPTRRFPGSYAWVITAKPQGSIAQLVNPNSVNPAFVPDVDGTYTVELTWTFLVESDTDSVDVVATTPPTP